MEMQSESIELLASALVKAQGEFSAVAKESFNPFFKSKYAALPDVVRHASPILSKHGLAVSQFMAEDDTLVTYLLHESGQFISHTTTMHLTKEDAQGSGSAVSYYRRYSYMSCLGLVADEDDDGNAAQKQETKSETRSAPQHQPRQLSEADTENIDLILKAAEKGGNDFLDSLAKQYIERGSLSAKQIESGVKSALKVLGVEGAVKSETQGDVPWPDEEPF
jgi:hypothetical protein